MANRDGVRWWLRLLLDPKSKKKVQEEAQDALNKGTDPRKAKKNLKDADSAFGKIASTAKKVGAAVVAAFAVGVVIDWTKRVVQAGKAIFDLGANVGETASKFRTTFGAAQKQVDEFLSSWGLMAGLTRTAGREITSTLGAIVQGMGATEEASATLSERILRLGGDLTSFYNPEGGIEQTLRALRSTLISGESEPGRQFGIFLRAAEVDQRALSIALKEGRSELTEMDRVLARVEMAYEQSTKAVGDLERTQDSQANQSRRSAAALQQVKESAAALLVEGFAAVPVFQDMNAGLEGLSTWIDNNEDSVRDLGTTFGHVASAVIGAASAFAGFIGWLERVDTAVDRWIAKHGPTAAGRRQARDRLEGGWKSSTGVIGEDPAAEEAERQRQQAAAARERAEAARKAAETAARAAKDAERARKEAERDLRVASTPSMIQVGPEQTPAARLARMRAGAAGVQAFLPGSVEAAGISPEAAEARREWKEAQADAAAYAASQWALVESASMNAAMGMAGAWQDAFSLLFEEGANLGEFMEQLGAGMAGAMLGGLAEFASGKVAENVAAALEAAAYALGFTSHGNFASAGAAWGAAAQHGAAAAAWSALAGGAGAAQSKVAGGGRGGLSGGIPTGARDIGGRIADRQLTSPEVHVYVDGINPNNPTHAKLVHAAGENARTRYGRNARVTVHSRGGAS